jgi:hypothetical protein
MLKTKTVGKSPGKNNIKMVLAVTYGHSTTVIGNINVNDNTNYIDAKLLIIPLVRIYLNMDPNDDFLSPPNSVSTGHNLPVNPSVNLPVNVTSEDYGESAQPCRNYGEEFVLLDPSGMPITDPNIASVSLCICVCEYLHFHNLYQSESNTIHISKITLCVIVMFYFSYL